MPTAFDNEVLLHVKNTEPTFEISFVFSQFVHSQSLRRGNRYRRLRYVQFWRCRSSPIVNKSEILMVVEHFVPEIQNGSADFGVSVRFHGLFHAPGILDAA